MGLAGTGARQPGMRQENRDIVSQIRAGSRVCIRICGTYGVPVASYRMGRAAQLLGVSADTLRRWVDAGRLPAERDAQGHRVVSGTALATFARSLAADEPGGAWSSARNRFTGIVTSVRLDTVMAQVEIQAGPHRVVSLMTRDAADELGLTVGALATASVKSTQVVVELPEAERGVAGHGRGEG